ncbi:MFS transporter [Aeromicrobium wangtongii]|uniref:MFS transporter n=1 Tax=Aeromicrobium wangtongii TaxID=2969247 RepID=A0ABY5MBU4_9ACTN|nr:MFS transporter [Aeromicrobium wangtongii]MCD9196647.1 MFS transporter [Aeromicrobium wangtongii]UUP14158.1 MFS transporter [Aeromicrobium wangtongii]
MTETTEPQLAPEERDRRWPALAVCLLAGAMTLLDVSIVNVALPSIREGLDAGNSTIQWVVAGYALAFGIVLVPAGRLGDARSRKTVFMAGVALFTVASAVCGAAQEPLWIGVARVAQGIGGGLITPQVSGFIQNLFKGPERGRAFGLFGATIGVSTAIGPVLGGLLIQLGGEESGWRLVFYVNVPIGILLMVMAHRYLPAAVRGPKQSLDPVGVLLFGAAMFFVLLPLVTGGQDSSLSQRPWWLLGISAALLIAFVLWERYWAGRDRETLLDMSLVKVRSFVLGVGLGTFYFAGFTSIFIVLTLYLQQGLGYSALEAGLTQLPFAVGSAVAALLGGRLVERMGRALVVTGLVLISVSLVIVDILVPHLGSDVGLKLAPVLLLAGLGGGLVISPNITLALDEVEPARAGAGGGLLQTAQRVGSAIGVAIVLALFFERVRSTRGDFADALSYSLHVTIGFVLVALLLGIADLARRARDARPTTDH